MPAKKRMSGSLTAWPRSPATRTAKGRRISSAAIWRERSDAIRGSWLAAQPQDGRQPEANLRSPASGVTSDVLHTVRQSDDAIFDFYLTRGRSDVELRDIAGEPIVLFRAERGSDGGAYTVHRNGVFVTKRPNPSV